MRSRVYSLSRQTTAGYRCAWREVMGTAISCLTDDYGGVKEEEMRNSAIASAITLLPLAL